MIPSPQKTTLEESLPQGLALSCTLFLIFINDITDNLKCMKALCTDDLVIRNSIIIGQRKIQEDLINLETYYNLWKLKTNITKTVYSIFTNSHLNLFISPATLKKEPNPVYLEVQIDRQMNLQKHISNTKRKAMKRLNLVKWLASSTWGSGKIPLLRIC